MRITEGLPGREGDVTVRRLGHHDAEAFAAGTKDEAVQRYGHLPLAEYSPQTVRDQVDNEIARGLDDGSLAVLAIADADSDEFLGSIVLFDVRSDRAEVGFWLTPQARGRGAARHGLRALLRVAADAGFRYLDARTDSANDGSRRVLEDAGFVHTEGPHDELAPSGEVVNVLTFERSLVELPN
ncbi:N-acetyltransferase [Mycolicibacterium chitae]|uniref:N-acetyltransferase GCN5 n=1 Tax=Mycolicibacterium chitae TaxID=1792 RepID=A0A448I1N2_MYCCI|nr:GNAT family N-acetyltransferase [Mycolicibacterium chitae]BBZ03125.1 N-acetyltransferase [Mycolicibacterium chitae]VEG46356.1 N-acetyltransferase GCN5 [Mycolicibacterium chitae]